MKIDFQTRTNNTVTMNSPFKMKKESRKGNKENRILRKGKSVKEPSDLGKFCGDGVDFKAKIIGTEHVLDARGNRMCQGALQRLKAAVKTSGDHKQRVILNISLNGIVIRDEKSRDPLHHHPIHKISFISQDTKDNRAFGYVFGCPQTGHEFFGIKTEKIASQVVLTLRDLFLTALEMKKQEIALEKAARGDVCLEAEQETEFITSIETEEETSSTLLDLQFTMNSLQQGISHIDESIAVQLPTEDNLSECSSNSLKLKMNNISSLYQETLSISSRSSSISEHSGCVPETPPRRDNPPRCVPFDQRNGKQDKRTISSSPSQENNTPPANRSEDRYAVFQDIDELPSIFDNPSIVKCLVTDSSSQKNYVDNADIEQESVILEGISSALPVVFAELDPLGNHPYVDKKDFFQALRKTPAKVLNDLVSNEPFSHELEEAHRSSSQGMSLGSFVPNLSPSPHHQWNSKYPTNPFMPRDLPPPSSPPPPPPPRIPTRMSTEISPTLPPISMPTPPLPRRRSQLSSTSQNWFSFDQDAIVYLQTQQHQIHADQESFTPPLPSPARKFTLSRKLDGPAIHHRISPSLSRHHSVVVAGKGTQLQSDCQLPSSIPPLPPKPLLLGEKLGSHASSSLSGSNVSSAGGHSSSSLVFSSSDDAKVGSGSEALLEADNYLALNGSVEKVSSLKEQSPDSIFRRKDDPFADEFFLTLTKKSTNSENGTELHFKDL